MKRKERRKKKQEKTEPIHNSALSKGRDNATSYENAKEVSTTYLRFFMRCIRGKVNCTVPPPPSKEKKIPSIASFTSYIENY